MENNAWFVHREIRERRVRSARWYISRLYREKALRRKFLFPCFSCSAKLYCIGFQILAKA